MRNEIREPLLCFIFVPYGVNFEDIYCALNTFCLNLIFLLPPLSSVSVHFKVENGTFAFAKRVFFLSTFLFAQAKPGEMSECLAIMIEIFV